MKIGDYTATVERNMLGEREWFLRVRYVAATTMGGRAQYRTFNLIPDHQGMMFFKACEAIEQAIERHAEGKFVNRSEAHV